MQTFKIIPSKITSDGARDFHAQMVNWAYEGVFIQKATYEDPEVDWTLTLEFEGYFNDDMLVPQDTLNQHGEVTTDGVDAYWFSGWSMEMLSPATAGGSLITMENWKVPIYCRIDGTGPETKWVFTHPIP